MASRTPAAKPAPAGVRGRDGGGIRRGQEHRQTVGHLDDADVTWGARDHGICARRPGGPAGTGLPHHTPVHLLKPERFLGQRERLAHAAAVLVHRIRRIPHVGSDVERVEGRRADPVTAQRECRTHAGRRGPCGREAGEGRPRHAGPDSRAASSDCMSAGSGASQAIGSPLSGCASLRLAACSAWRGKALSAAVSAGGQPAGRRRRPP